MNWYRNAHYIQQSAAKRDYHAHIAASLHDICTASTEPLSKYTLHITIYYRNAGSDGSNIAALVEKFSLDALQSLGLTTQDNVTSHVGTTWTTGEQDKLNPRCEIIVTKEG